MDGTVLGDAIMAAIDALGPLAEGETAAARRRAVFRAMGAAIVAHVKTAAVVATATAVTPGVGTSPVTGTIE